VEIRLALVRSQDVHIAIAFKRLADPVGGVFVPDHVWGPISATDGRTLPDDRFEIDGVPFRPSPSLEVQPQPLEVDPTAALAYQLEANPIWGLELAAFLRAGVVGREIPRDRAHDGLFILQPYRPGKIPVVLVHGTASNPARWAELVNELNGDGRLRERYQVWVFVYDTGNPIGFSAGRLREALTAAVQELESAGPDPALHRMVVIGHSQGGLLTKLTAIDSGTRFWDNISQKPIDEIDVSPETRELLRRSAFYTPLPFVKRVVFISTPHRGAMMAGNWLGSIAAGLVTLPATMVRQFGEAATTSGDEKLIAVLRRPPTAIDNMNPRHVAIRTLASIPVDPASRRTRSSPWRGMGRRKRETTGSWHTRAPTSTGSCPRWSCAGTIPFRASPRRSRKSDASCWSMRGSPKALARDLPDRGKSRGTWVGLSL
jgi:pimeloyl-ACP methyl ester carboxylesterase